jgi:hypothetical protein
VTILDFGVPEALIAGDVLAHLARRGALIGVEDLLIGATPLGASPRWRWARVLPLVLASALTRAPAGGRPGGFCPRPRSLLGLIPGQETGGRAEKRRLKFLSVSRIWSRSFFGGA